VVWFLLVALVVLFGDYASKLAITETLALGESIPVLGQFFRLTYIRNPGAAFGLFPGSRVPFIIISVLAIVVVLAMTLLSRDRKPIRVVPLGLIFGGAFGNLLDRMRSGEVVDFLDVGIGHARWPVFNLADSAVTVGVMILALSYLRRPGPAGSHAVLSGSPDSR
jgi:signal peptidase II